MSSGFGRKNGSLSANTLGVSTVTDRGGGFLSLVKSIGGSDLIFCLDAYDIKNVAVSGTITNWYDSAFQFESYFTEAANKPAFGLFRNKPSVSFNTTDIMATATSVAALNGVKDLSIVWAQKFNNIGTGFLLEWGPRFDLNQSFAIGGIGSPTSNSRAFIVSQYDGGYCTNAPNSDYVQNDQPVVLGAVLNRNSPGSGYNKSTKPYVNGKLLSESEQANVSGLLDDMTTAFTSNLTFYLGSRAGGTNGWDGYLFSMVLVKRQLTESEMSRISQAMLSRWAISSTEALV